MESRQRRGKNPRVRGRLCALPQPQRGEGVLGDMWSFGSSDPLH